MLDAATDRDHAPGSHPLSPECSANGHASSRGVQGGGGVEQSVGHLALLRASMAEPSAREYGPCPTETFFAEDNWNAGALADRYAKTYGGWVRRCLSGDREVFEVWGGMGEREWRAAEIERWRVEGRAQRAAAAAKKHECDEDCRGHIVDGECTVCGVWHNTACDLCKGRGYHKEGCDGRQWEREDPEAAVTTVRIPAGERLTIADAGEAAWRRLNESTGAVGW